MKKDVEWAKKKIKEIHTLTFDSYEAAVIANNKHFQMKNSEQLALINRIMETLDQLDEPERLSQEWIDNHTASAYTIAHYSEEDVRVIMVSDLENLLVPKLDLPEIPDYVAEYIVNEEESEVTLEETLKNMKNIDYQSVDVVVKTSDYFDENPVDFIDAYRYGYTVEEKKCVVKTNIGTYFILDERNRAWDYTELPEGDDSIKYATKFVEKERAEAIALLIDGTVKEVNE